VSHLWERARVSHLMNADLPESVTSACQFSGVSSRVAEAVATDATRQMRASMNAHESSFGNPIGKDTSSGKDTS